MQATPIQNDARDAYLRAKRNFSRYMAAHVAPCKPQQLPKLTAAIRDAVRRLVVAHTTGNPGMFVEWLPQVAVRALGVAAHAARWKTRPVRSHAFGAYGVTNRLRGYVFDLARWPGDACGGLFEIITQLGTQCDRVEWSAQVVAETPAPVAADALYAELIATAARAVYAEAVLISMTPARH